VRARRTPPVGDPLIQHALLGEAVDHGPAAIFVMGDDRKYVAVNETACRLLGYERAELLGLDPAELAPESDVDARLEELARTGSLEGRVTLRAKNGDLIPVQYRASAATAAHMRFWISVAFPE
jgi:PAS domain S-box-containing protein